MQLHFHPALCITGDGADIDAHMIGTVPAHPLIHIIMEHMAVRKAAVEHQHQLFLPLRTDGVCFTGRIGVNRLTEGFHREIDIFRPFHASFNLQ